MRFDQLDLLIGRLFIIGFNGRSPEEDFLPRYRQLPAGGVILFARNLGGVEEIKALTAAVEAAGKEVHGFSLFIAVDQEGGNLSPLRGRVTSLPGNMGLAATGDPAAAYYAGRRTAVELRGLGFNLVFAPVLDLAANPANPVIGARAFSDDPETVATFGRALASGLVDGGILFTAKHFPGHGSCREDSHITLPLCSTTRESLWQRDLLPFRKVLDLSGASVMTAHVRYSGLDPENPATISPRILQDLLRGEMGFDGVVITDDLEMEAIRSRHSPAEAAVRALAAGADLVLVCHTFADQLAAFAAVKLAVKEGRLSMARIQEAAARVARWREKSGMEPVEDDWERHWDPSILAEKVITLLGEAGSWPFDHSPLAVVDPAYRAVTPAEDVGEIEPFFATMGEIGVPFARFNCQADPGPEEIASLVETIRSGGYRRIVLILRHAAHYPGQRLLAVRLAEAGRLLLVSLGDPRETPIVGREFPALCAYSSEPPVLVALARALGGELTPTGRLPVRLAPVAEASV
ncbi:MAG: beta-N-acetylhexosaminidase [Firmicutes bacterium]|nr:beta-N-acetylhexosaminidase [Bacillota bacterium]